MFQNGFARNCIITAYLLILQSFPTAYGSIPQEFKDRYPHIRVVSVFGDTNVVGESEGSYDGGGLVRSISLPPNTQTLAILADKLDLRQCAVVEIIAPPESLRKVVIIANRVMVGRHTRLMFSGQNGVSCTLISRELEFTADSALEIQCVGSGATSPHVGSLQVCVNTLTVDGETKPLSCLLTKCRNWELVRYQFTDNAGMSSSLSFTPKPPQLLWPSMRDREQPETEDGVEISLPTFKDSDVTLMNVTTAQPELAAPALYGLWMIQMLDQIQIEMSGAALSGNTGFALLQARKLKSLPNWPSDPILTGELSRALTTAVALAKGYQGLPFTEHVTLHGESKDLQLSLEGQGLVLKVLPTDVLLLPRKVGDREVLGLLAFNNQNPQQVTLTSDFKLKLADRWAKVLQRRLLQNGEALHGLTLSGRFVPKPPYLDGVEDVKAVLVGDVLQITFTLDTSRAAPALWRLSTAEGLPVQFDWKPSSRNDESITLEYRFSLGRRYAYPLEITDEGIRNIGRELITLEYFLCGDDLAIPISSQAMTLLPSSTTTLLGNFRLVDTSTGKALNASPIFGEISNDGFVIHSAEDPLAEFDRADGLVETIRIQNLVPAFDEQRQLALEFLEILIEENSDSPRKLMPIGPIRLSPRGALGSETLLPYLKTASSRKFTISGKAIYSGGSTAILNLVTEASRTVFIKPSDIHD